MPIIREVVLLLQQAGYVRLLFRVKVSLTIHWESWEKVAPSLSQGLRALSQLNPHQGKHFLALFTSPNHTLRHTHSHYSLHTEVLQANQLFIADCNI